MDHRRNSNSPNALYASYTSLGSGSAPIIIDVRRDANSSGADALMADAFHCSP